MYTINGLIQKKVEFLEYIYIGKKERKENWSTVEHLSCCRAEAEAEAEENTYFLYLKKGKEKGGEGGLR